MGVGVGASVGDGVIVGRSCTVGVGMGTACAELLNAVEPVEGAVSVPHPTKIMIIKKPRTRSSHKPFNPILYASALSFSNRFYLAGKAEHRLIAKPAARQLQAQRQTRLVFPGGQR